VARSKPSVNTAIGVKPPMHPIEFSAYGQIDIGAGSDGVKVPASVPARTAITGNIATKPRSGCLEKKGFVKHFSGQFRV